MRYKKCLYIHVLVFMFGISVRGNFEPCVGNSRHVHVHVHTYMRTANSSCEPDLLVVDPHAACKAGPNG